jgi:hypothetical protein
MENAVKTLVAHNRVKLGHTKCGQQQSSLYARHQSCNSCPRRQYIHAMQGIRRSQALNNGHLRLLEKR